MRKTTLTRNILIYRYSSRFGVERLLGLDTTSSSIQSAFPPYMCRKYFRSVDHCVVPLSSGQYYLEPFYNGTLYTGALDPDGS